MSWNAILDAFFHDPRLIKRKMGGKWYFPVRETRVFLKIWLLEQYTHCKETSEKYLPNIIHNIPNKQVIVLLYCYSKYRIIVLVTME